MKWTEVRLDYMTATVGPLFAYIKGNGGHLAPDHPDHEPESFNWHIAPDQKDKHHRRALADGYAETIDIAKYQVALAIQQIIDQMREDMNDD